MPCLLLWYVSGSFRSKCSHKEFGGIQGNLKKRVRLQVPPPQILSRGEKFQAQRLCGFSVKTAGNLSMKLIMPSQAWWGQTTGKLLSSLYPSRGREGAGSVAHHTAVRRGTHFLRGMMKRLSLSESPESFITETDNIMQNRLESKNLTS